MKHWQETSRILQMLERLSEQGRSAAVATVVHIDGSAYRRAGAKMLIADDGMMSGSVSGGCLEADVREVAFAVIGHGIPQMLHYETGLEDEMPFGLGLGCDGAVDIFVQRATAPEFLEISRRIMVLLKGDEAFALSTIVRGTEGLGRSVLVGAHGRPFGSTGDSKLDGLIAARAGELHRTPTSQLDDLEGRQVFTEVQVPPPSLVILGAGDDTRALVTAAADVGFRVTVVDHRPAYLARGRYPATTHLVEARPGADISRLRIGPRSYAIVKTHSLEHDREWIRHLLATDTPYIGVLGSRERIQAMLRELDADDDDRIFGPVGLDLGADGAEQIAVSVVAELLAVLSGREPGHLREKEGFIHAG
jgi:xanthine/CO dehydrogenase XdhC/CoxF family maturation factor